ncbi:ATP-dependent RNA helicase dhx29 [Rhizopus microsporus]
MAKKKSKQAGNNRGFATVSAPSKKAETPTKIEEPIEKPTEPSSNKSLETCQVDHKDKILQLVEKYRTLHELKADSILDKMQKEDMQTSARKIRSFRLGSNLEKELISIIKQKEGGLFELCPAQPKSEQAKEKLIGQLDILYRALVKLGFSDIDIYDSFKSTLSTSIDDHLDWLCINTPYERMPVGFFDKYYNEEEGDSSVTLIHNTSKKKTSNHESGQDQIKQEVDLVVKKHEKEQDKLDEIKFRILQAANEYMDEQDQNVNEKHAMMKIRLQELESLLPSKKKNKKKQKDDTSIEENVDMNAVMKEVKHIKDSLSSLEIDWEFDQRKANELYLKKLELAAEEKRKVQEEEIKARKESEQGKPKDNRDVLDDDVEDDEGGLFGGLMGEEEEAAYGTEGANQPNTETSWTIIELSVPQSWKGQYPKDVLTDYCKRNSLGKQTYKTTEHGFGTWRSALKIAQDKHPNEPLCFELPKGLATNSRNNAENLIAAYTLFSLDPNTSVYKVIPTVYKDLWLEWLNEKQLKEEGPRIEMDKQRFAFITDLVNNSFTKLNQDDIPADDQSSPEPKPKKESNVTAKQSSKLKSKFKRAKESFKNRIETKKYIDMKGKRNDLPVAAYREEILELVKKNQVLIISGETGCGKSTQVPQFLAEDLLLGSSESGLVICTQPRRISAMSIANRVSMEMGDAPNTTGSKNAMVGYQIRLENKVSEENVLLYCTTGILLQRLQNDLHLDGVSHVIVDEVHERTIDSDFLLVMLKKLISLRHDLKVILMSATVEAKRFSEYFYNCPVITVPGRTYPVQVQFLEDIVQATGYVLEEDSPFALRKTRTRAEHGSINVSGRNGSKKRIYYDMFEDDTDEEDAYDSETKLNIQEEVDDINVEQDEYSKQTRKMIKRMDDKKINYDLILELLEYICISKPKETGKDSAQKEDIDIPSTGAILIFLPGINEIRALYDLISSHHILGDPEKFLLIPLHSTLTSEHQEKAFDVPPKGIRKIVLSTNIAETGVTISDVTVVIDSGMARVVSYDDKRRVTRLLQKYVAKANIRQRRGRAGRVQKGICFHMFTKQRFEEMPDFETPEILRLPLEELCLRIKVYNLGSIRSVLSTALDKPSSQMIDNAIASLKEAQALTTEEEERLTPLGSHLVNLPVDIHIGKMILFGAIFRCLDPILTIAAMLSYKSPFTRPFGKEREADIARSRFEIGESDFLTMYQAYDAWRNYLMQVRGKPGWLRHMHEFCKENFLSQQNLEMIEEMKRQFLALLINIGFVKTSKLDISINRYDIKRSIHLCDVPSAYNKYSGTLPVVNAALTAGLYPKIAEYVRESGIMANRMMEVKLHPSSMLFLREKELHSEILAYNTLIMGNKEYQRNRAIIRDATSVDPVALVLLTRDIKIQHKQRKITLDNWLSFDCFARTAVILKFFRNELNRWLAEKMKDPAVDLTAYNQDILDAIAYMLQSCNY